MTKEIYPIPVKKRFLQPLALALVCAILILLLFTIRWIDLRTLDTTLTSYMNDSANDIIDTVQTEIDYHFSLLMPSAKVGSETDTLSPIPEAPNYLKERLIINLIETAQEIEYQMKDEDLNNKNLVVASEVENLWLVSFLNEKGVPSSQNRSIPEEILNLAAPVAQGFEEIKVNLFDPSLNTSGLGYLIVRQKSGKGAILLVFKEDGLGYRSLKLSVQIALENLGQIQDLEYIQLADQNFIPLGKIGDAPELQTENIDMDNVTADGRNTAIHKISFNNLSILEIIAPIAISGGEDILVRFGLNRDNAEQIIKESKNSLFISMAFMAIITILAMMLLYFNQNRHMAKIQEMERQMLQAERLSALGRLAAGVAHEIRNPLNAISMATQRLQTENLPDLTGVIRDEIRRLNQIIQDFLTFSTSRKLKLQNRDLLSFLEQIVLLINEEAKAKNITIEKRWSEDSFKIHMDLDKLKQALINIIKNAMESISEKGTILTTVTTKDKKWISLKIEDTGMGMNQEELKNIFDPDYTTKEKGLGLGLPLAHEIIKGHGGEIKVTSQLGKGTTFEILFPKG